MNKHKKEFTTIKEFNLWSNAIGWRKWYENYKKNKDNYVWQEYIEDHTYLTPTPWIKKLANPPYNDKYAIKEMQKRYEESQKINMLDLQSRGIQKEIQTAYADKTVETKESEL